MSPRRVPVLALTLAIACQAQQATPKVFDVASIKPNADNDNRIMIRLQPGGVFTATGITARQLINQAFNVRDHQISGGPGWISSDRYDIKAKAEGLPDHVPPGEMRPYLKNLLEDRFKLKTHSEEKEMPIYALVVGKGGPKLKATEGTAPGPGMRMGRGEINATKVTLSMLAQQLSQQLGRNVVDKTGLSGEFDILLQWTPEVGQGGGGPFGGPPPPDAIPAGDSSGPTIFTALQEQLGLRLESQRGPVPVLIIDSIEKPSEN
jgi:uncharacterized protein (TIGR03435 family)